MCDLYRRALKDEEVWTMQQQPMQQRIPASRLRVRLVRQEVAQRMVAPDPAKRPSCRELWNGMCVPDVDPLVPFAAGNKSAEKDAISAQL